MGDEIKDEIKKLYLIHRKKLYKTHYPQDSKILENAIKNIINNAENLGCAPSPPLPIKNEIENENEDILYDMLNFFKVKLKNQFEENRAELKVIRDNLYGNKIRIDFIGNISVWKSALLNFIIGEDILPTVEDDCTFRAIIIKNKDIDEYLLYQTKETEFGRGTKKYMSFFEKDKPYCRGIEKINHFLQQKILIKK